VVAGTWLQIGVELVGGRDVVCDPRPGRVMMVGPARTFAVFAEAIDAAFARWDLSHLHSFELADGRRIGFPDSDFDEPRWLDHAVLRVASEVAAGDEFSYTFDFGDDWRHRCWVLADKVDPRVEYGSLPKRPVAIWGWGWIPDQYGRETFGEVEE
jgi:Plasmid pRiA4b ORF-3-like protein